jgi:hypothetical protein
MQAARRSPRSVAVDEIQQEVGLPHVTAGRRAVMRGTSCRWPLSARHGYGPMDGQPAVYLYIAALEVNVLNCRGQGLPGCRGAGVLVRRARRTGPVTLDGEAVAGHGAGRERETRPGCLDATEARGMASGMAGAWRPWAVLGRGRTPARIFQRALTPAGGPGPRNVAAGSAGAVQAAGCRRVRVLGTSLPVETVSRRKPCRSCPAAARLVPLAIGATARGPGRECH